MPAEITNFALISTLTLTLSQVVIKWFHWRGTGSSKNTWYVRREFFHLSSGLVHGIKESLGLVFARLLFNRFIWFLGWVVNCFFSLLGNSFIRFDWLGVELTLIFLRLNFLLLLRKSKNNEYFLNVLIIQLTAAFQGRNYLYVFEGEDRNNKDIIK